VVAAAVPGTACTDMEGGLATKVRMVTLQARLHRAAHPVVQDPSGRTCSYHSGANVAASIHAAASGQRAASAGWDRGAAGNPTLLGSVTGVGRSAGATRLQVRDCPRPATPRPAHCSSLLPDRPAHRAPICAVKRTPVVKGVDYGARPLLHAVHTKGVNAMFKRPTSPTFQRAVSFKWLVGLIFILGSLYALFVNHVSLLDAATLFGIGVILV
jgi:hypothetical protein